MLAVNSGTRCTLRSVSLSPPFGCAFGAKPTIGGSAENALKYENGARLMRPSRSIDVIQPIGRGATSALRGLNFSGAGFRSMRGS